MAYKAAPQSGGFLHCPRPRRFGNLKSAPKRGGLVVKEQIAQRGIVRPNGPRAGLRSIPPEIQSKSPAHGIEVHEDSLNSVRAQRLYKLRCECGKSWFELELPKIVQCPACLKPGLVSV
jgi:hypothetical protein